MLARHVSDLIGPSSGAFYTLYLQIWFVVIRVLLDTFFVTAGRVKYTISTWALVLELGAHGL